MPLPLFQALSNGEVKGVAKMDVCDIASQAGKEAPRIVNGLLAQVLLFVTYMLFDLLLVYLRRNVSLNNSCYSMWGRCLLHKIAPWRIASAAIN